MDSSECLQKFNSVKEISNLRESGVQCDKNPGHTQFIQVNDLFSSMVRVSNGCFLEGTGFITKQISDSLLHGICQRHDRTYFLLTTRNIEISHPRYMYTPSLLRLSNFKKDFIEVDDINVDFIKVVESGENYCVILCSTQNILLINKIEKFGKASLMDLIYLCKSFLLTHTDQNTEFIQCVLLSRMTFIKHVLDRTVRLAVRHVSTNRPDSDVLATCKGKSGHIHYGTGFVIEMVVKDKVSGENECAKCCYFLLGTANHVIFDDSEAEQTYIDLFYDDVHGYGILKARGVKVIDSNIDCDFSVVLCVTDDRELCEKLSSWPEVPHFNGFSFSKLKATYFQRNGATYFLSKNQELCYVGSCKMDIFYLFLSQTINTIKKANHCNTSNILDKMLLCLASNNEYVQEFFVKFVQEAKTKLWSGSLIELLKRLSEHLSEIPTNTDVNNYEISMLTKELLKCGYFKKFQSIMKRIFVKIFEKDNVTLLKYSSLFQGTEENEQDMGYFSRAESCYVVDNREYFFQEFSKWLELTGLEKCRDNLQYVFYVLVSMKIIICHNDDSIDFLTNFVDGEECGIIQQFSVMFNVVCRQLKSYDLFKDFTLNYGFFSNVKFEIIYEQLLKNIASECENIFKIWQKHPFAASQNMMFHVSHPHGKEKQITFGEVKDLTTYNGLYEMRYNIPTCKGSSGGPVCFIPEGTADVIPFVVPHSGYRRDLQLNISSSFTTFLDDCNINDNMTKENEMQSPFLHSHDAIYTGGVQTTSTVVSKLLGTSP